MDSSNTNTLHVSSPLFSRLEISSTLDTSRSWDIRYLVNWVTFFTPNSLSLRLLSYMPTASVVAMRHTITPMPGKHRFR